jgi:hypothetical protein
MNAITTTNQKQNQNPERVPKSKEQIVHRQLELIEELYQIDLRLIDYQRKLDQSDRMEEVAIIELANARSLIFKALSHIRNKDI